MQVWNRKAALLLFTLASLLIIVRGLGSLIVPVYDDAYITFRYGRNLAAGQGFTFDPGPPVLGTTTPLFGLVAALIHTLSLPIEPSVITFNIAVDVLILLLTVRALWAGGGPIEGIAFGLLFAASPIATRIAVGGMEMNLFLLMSVSSVLLYFRGHDVAAAALAAAAVFVRPEGIALLCIVLATDLYRQRRIRLTLVAFAILVPALLVIYWYFGHVIPQSVIAKARQLDSSSLGVLREFLFADPLCILALPFAAWGALCALRREGFVFTMAVWGIAYLGAYLIFRPHPWSWYGEPVHYVEFLLAAVGGADLLYRVPRLAAQVTATRLALVGAPAMVLVWIAIFVTYGPSRVTASVYDPLEAWCREHIQPGAVIVAEDIGAIGYFSGARIYDTRGLVWPAAVSYRSLREIVVTQQPDYLFLNLARVGQAMEGTELGKLYEPVRRFSTSRSASLRPHPTDVPDEWVQEYILFQRIGMVPTDSREALSQ